jgi:hypothetical protein
VPRPRNRPPAGPGKTHTGSMMMPDSPES